jgi:hypothetical protein
MRRGRININKITPKLRRISHWDILSFGEVLAIAFTVK